MKKILSLCLLAALLCSCSIFYNSSSETLTTTSDTLVRDSPTHPLGGYKYFKLITPGRPQEVLRATKAEDGTITTVRQQEDWGPAKHILNFMMKKGYVFLPEQTDEVPEGTLLIICAEDSRLYSSEEATIQFVDAKTKDLRLMVSESSFYLSDAYLKCMKKAFGETY